MASLSVAIITLNEEERIRACLESVSWVEDLVVVDAGSSDKTVPIAREFTAQVLHRDWTGYGAQKNFAMAQCRGDWVLSLDADERVSPALRTEIERHLAGDPPVVGFLVPRQNWFQGRWVRHGGWYPDHQLRLVRRGQGAFGDALVHEAMRVAGPTRRLAAPLIHESYRGVSDFVARSHRYAELAAQQLARERRGGSAAGLLLRPAWRFLAMYVLRRGFLDGWPGLVLAALYAHHVFVREVRARELRRPSAERAT